jgi:hypothetical protein
MADLIDRKELLVKYDYYHEGEPGKARKLIEAAPSVDAVEVVRCRACVHAVEIEKDYVRKLFVDGTKQCELGRADTVFGYSIISNDGFCDSGERKEDG